VIENEKKMKSVDNNLIGKRKILAFESLWEW
jgi:hypothetical protein